MQPLPRRHRLVNAIGGALRGLGVPLVRLDPERLIAEARATTGLTDFGDEGFRVPLGVIVASLEREAGLTLLGRRIARGELLQALANRLILHHERTRRPELAAIPVDRPIFIVGLPRTGTTLLHGLLAQDTAARAPLSWEAARPGRLDENGPEGTAARIEATRREIEFVDRVIPDYKRIHPIGPMEPVECVQLMVPSLASPHFATLYAMPTYERWMDEEADGRVLYRTHRHFLQHLSMRDPRPRWVLKAPAHLCMLAPLLREYPDACLVQTHRDPMKVLPSVISLHRVLRGMCADPAPPLALAREMSRNMHRHYDAALDARRSGLVRPGQILDVMYRDLVRDPLGTVRTIYDAFGFTLTPEAERRMRAYLHAHPQDRHGRHVYRFADTGLDLSQERARADEYLQHFGIPSEDAA